MQQDILVTRSSMPDFEEYADEIRGLWDSRWLTNNGAIHKKLEAALKEYLGVENLELVVNGHLALELSIQALELTGEIITTPFTFVSTTHSIVRQGLTPVFCDIDPADCTMDVTKIESLITEKTSAILPVHVYGNLCNLEAIQEIADRHGLKVIYDAAHTFGEKYDGQGIGSFGDVSCFSFHATKVFHTIEGGAICFKDSALKAKFHALKDFGFTGSDEVIGEGTNAKMNEFAAAMGLCNLRHVDGEIAKRKKVVERYRENLKGIPGLRLCGGSIPKRGFSENRGPAPEILPNYAYFPVFFDPEEFGADRDTVWQTLAEHRIFARKYFYPVTSAFACYRDRFDPSLTPEALRASERVLTLPLYADLDLKDVDRIAEIVRGCGKV